MIDREAYLEDKQDRIGKWLNQLAKLDTLCRETGVDARIKLNVQLKEFSENIDELSAVFREFQKLNDYGREKLRQVIEKNLHELKKSFKSSLSEYEDLIRAKTGKNMRLGICEKC